MTPEELYEEWTSGEQNGMRPQRVKHVRVAFEEATGMAVPTRIHEIEGWLETMQQSGVITKKLRAAAEGTDDDDE